MFGQGFNIDAKLNWRLKDIETSPSKDKLGVLGQNKLLIFDREWNLINYYNLSQNATKCVFVSEDSIFVLSSDGIDCYSTGKKQVTSKIIRGTFNDIFFDLKERKLYVANQTKVQIYSLTNSKVYNLKVLETSNKISCIQGSPSYLFVGYESGQISVFDKSNCEELKQLTGHKSRVDGISHCKNETIIVSNSSRNNSKQIRGEMIFWNIASGENVYRTEDKFKEVIMTIITSDSLIYVSSSNLIQQFDSKGNTLKLIWNGGSNDAPTIAFFNNQIVYGYTYEGGVCSRLFARNIETGELERTISDFMGRPVWQLRNSHDDQLFLYLEGKAMFLNPNGALVRSHDVQAGSDMVKLSNQILYSAEMNSKNRAVLTTYNFQNQENQITKTDFEFGSLGNFNSIDASLVDGSIYVITTKQLFNLSSNKVVFTWEILSDTTPGTLGYIFAVPQYIERKFISSSDFFCEYGEKNRVLNIRNIFSGELHQQFVGFEPVKSESPDDFVLFDTKRKELNLLNRTNFSLQKLLNVDEKPYSVCINEKFQMISIKVNEYKSELLIYNLKTDETVLIKPKSRVTGFTFSKNGKYLVTGNFHGEIEIWNCDNGDRKGLIYFRMEERLDYVIYFENFLMEPKLVFKNCFERIKSRILRERKVCWIMFFFRILEIRCSTRS
ncbi:MAG: hypothetical protein IPG07_06165 [Crocinitomicaceae bacterium]|nr:hypothetical protein [Crocinitomicaceae bacterium]